MCGIFGFLDATSSALFASDQKIIWGLSLLTSMRGADATGFFGVDVDKKWVDIIKGAGTPYEINYYKAFDTFYERIVKNYNLVIGHGRLATVGNKVAQNAHPFQHGKITMVHNGTLTNFKRLQEKYKTNFEVDSELVCYLINKVGIEETVDEIEGAYALVWWNSEEGTLNLLRNSQRPLAYAISDNQRRMLIASEGPTIAWAAYSHKTDKYPSVKDVPINEHMKIPITADKYDLKVDIEFKKCSPKSYHVVPHHSHHHGAYTYPGYTDYADDYVPPTRSAPSTYQKPPAKPIHQTIICRNEDLQFVLKDYDELETVTGDQKTYLLNGKIEDCPHVEVVAKYTGTEEDLDTILDSEEPSLFFGIVKEMRWIGFGGTIRVFLDKAEPVSFNPTKEQVKNLLIETGMKYIPAVPSHATSVKIKGHAPLGVANFIAIASKGCYTCGGELKYVYSEYFKLLYTKGSADDKDPVARLMCKECTQKDDLSEGANNGEKSTASTVQ